MASCIELLKKSFPKIEGELQEYVSSKFQFTSFVTIISLNETTSVASIYYFMLLFSTTGILENGSDEFESSDEIYDAIGGILHEVATDKSENDVK